jgi:hypothetical protein
LLMWAFLDGQNHPWTQCYLFPSEFRHTFFFLSSCVVVILNPKENKQQHIFNTAR